MVVDANVLIAVFILEDSHHDASRSGLGSWTIGGGRLTAPAILLPELGGAIARRSGDRELAHRALNRVRHNPAVEVVPLDSALPDQAAQLAIDLRLRGADACYVAVAKRLGLRLLTWDEEMRSRAAGVVEVITPAELQRDTR